MTEVSDEIIIEEQESEQVDDVEYIEIKDPYGFIYITTNLVNGERYLGQKRFDESWERYLGSGTIFKSAVEKYGKENFKRDIILICYSDEELNQAEFDLSVWFDVVESNNWYNLVLGGGTSRGWHPSEETKKKISDKAKERYKNPENHPMFGTHLFVGENNPMYHHEYSEETLKKMSESQKRRYENQDEVELARKRSLEYWETHEHPSLGKHLSEEQKNILSEKAFERYKNKENHPMYGKHHSDEAKQQMSDFRSGPDWWKCRRVYCIELNEIFFGAQNANDLYGFDSSGIIKCCRGKRKTCGKHPTTKEPLHWLYSEDAINQGFITEENLNDYLNNLNSKERK